MKTATIFADGLRPKLVPDTFQPAAARRRLHFGQEPGGLLALRRYAEPFLGPRQGDVENAPLLFDVFG